MKLITKPIEKQLLATPLGSTDGQGGNAKVIAKFFNPCGAGTWLVTEAEKQDDDSWLFYGAAHIHCWEWGYVSLGELEAIKLPYGLTIERDLHPPATVKQEWADA